MRAELEDLRDEKERFLADGGERIAEGTLSKYQELPTWELDCECYFFRFLLFALPHAIRGLHASPFHTHPPPVATSAEMQSATAQ